MTNQKYIEEIRKVAEKGGWDKDTMRFYADENGTWDYCYEIAFLDPNFYRAIGKVKMWGKPVLCRDGTIRTFDHAKKTEWSKNMHTFLDKIIEKDLDHAIEWLYNLIKE